MEETWSVVSGSNKPSVPLPCSAVTFSNVKEKYEIGRDIHLSYKISEDLEPKSRDWIGLFKVGWRTWSNYFCYVWALVPKNHDSRQLVAKCVVTFPAAQLPRDEDDDNFYQFCYIDASGMMRGASPPFQFLPSDCMELVEMEEEEGGGLRIIQAKWNALEMGMKAVNQSKLKLEKELHEKATSLEDLHEELKRTKEQLTKKTLLTSELVSQMDMKNQLLLEYETQNCQLQKAIETLRKEKMDICSEVDILKKSERDFRLKLEEKIKQLLEKMQKEKLASFEAAKSYDEQQQQHLLEEQRLRLGYMNDLEMMKLDHDKVIAELEKRFSDQLTELQDEKQKLLLELVNEKSMSSQMKDKIDFLCLKLGKAEAHLQRPNPDGIKTQSDLEVRTMLNKKQSEEKTMDAAMEQMQIKNSIQLSDRLREIDDLRNRLKMGEEAFKEKFIECETLKRLLNQKTECNNSECQEMSFHLRTEKQLSDKMQTVYVHSESLGIRADFERSFKKNPSSEFERPLICSSDCGLWLSNDKTTIRSEGCRGGGEGDTKHSNLRTCVFCNHSFLVDSDFAFRKYSEHVNEHLLE